MTARRNGDTKFWDRSSQSPTSIERTKNARSPFDPIVRFLMVGILTTVGLGSIFSSQPEPPQPPLFVESAAKSGLLFRHFTGATGEYFMPEIMGAGVALLDYDGDGDLDVYLIQGTVLAPGSTPDQSRFPPSPGWKPGNRLFRNELIPTGELRFTDVTEKAGVGVVGYGMGAAVGDYDNDGHPDLYVTNFGRNFLLHNNGNGTFTDVTQQAGVDDARWSTSAAWVDYDHDGDLDLFVANYLDFTVKGSKQCYAATGERDYCTPMAYRAVPCRLFRNDGGGRFTDVTQQSGIGSALGPSLGVACADFNGDGRIDIYVANDTAANLLWLNKGNGTFEEGALSAGAAYSETGLPRAGMGVTAGDFDNDGDEDLLVTNLKGEGSTLFRNNGRGSFRDATQEFGLAQPSFAYTGFGVAWLDYDNDGRLDLFIANGAVTIMESLRGSAYPFQQKNLLFHNEGSKARFRETTAVAGPALQLAEVSRGAAFGDIDNDGDVDVVLTNNNGPVRLLLNQTNSRAHWLSLRLQGVKDNRDGLGARVGVFRKDQPTLWRRAHTDGSYLSSGDPRIHFGLGQNTAIETVEVRWPNGLTERWSDVPVDRLTKLSQGTGKEIR